MKKKMILSLSLAALLSGVGLVNALGIRDVPKLTGGLIKASIQAVMVQGSIDAAKEQLETAAEEMEDYPGDEFASARIGQHAGAMGALNGALGGISDLLLQLSDSGLDEAGNQKLTKKGKPVKPGPLFLISGSQAAKFEKLAHSVGNLQAQLAEETTALQAAE